MAAIHERIKTAMAYKIGTLTLSASWTIGGHVHLDPGFEAGLNCEANFNVALDFLSASGSIEPFSKTLSASSGNSVTIHNDDNIDLEGLDDSLGGSVQISVPCDICWEYTGLSPTQVNPYFLEVVDSPPYRKIKFFLVGNGDAVVNASWSGMSISGPVNVRGQKINPSVHHSCGAVAHGTVIGESTQTIASASSSINLGATTNIPADMPSGVNTSDSFTTSFGLPRHSQSSAGPGGVSASSDNGLSASATCSWQAVRNFNLSGILRAMERTYPETVTLSLPRYYQDPDPIIEASGGQFSRSGTQHFYDTSAAADAGGDEEGGGDFDSLGKHTFQDIAVNMDEESLTTIGDEPLARRVLMRGKAVDGMVINQAASYSLEDFTSGSWLSLGEADLTLAGGVLTIDTAANPGGASRSYSPERSTSGYRYLRVRLRSVGSANIPVTVSLGGYGWTIQSGAAGVWSETEIDLCAPGGVDYSDLADGWDTRWPLPTQTSVTSGPFSISGISINSIPAGVTVEFDTITLVRHSLPTIDLMPTLNPSRYHPANDAEKARIEPEWPVLMGPERVVAEPEEGDTVSQDYVRRGLLVNTDGRQSIEEPDLWYTRTEGGATGTVVYFFHHLSIGAMVGQINAVDNGIVRWGGWSATASVADPGTFTPAYTNQPAPAVPYYYNEVQLLATELYGGGAFYTQTNGWQFGFDRPTGLIRAQPLFDAVEMCGMEGDAFGHGGGAPGDSSSLTLVAAAILRAGAHGLVFQEGVNAGQPAENADLDMLQNDTVVSTGTSRAKDGWYHMTSLPYAKTPVWSGIVRSAEWQPEVDPEDELPQVNLGTLYTRHRHRASLFAVPVGHSCCSLLTGPRFYLPFASSRQGQEGQAQRGEVQQDPTQMSTRDWRRILPETVMPTPEEEFTH